MLILALLSIGVASAEDVSSLDAADMQDTAVSMDLMNDSSTEVVTSEYVENNSLDTVSKDSLKSQNEDDLASENTESSNIKFSTSNIITNSNLNEETPVAAANGASGSFTDLYGLITNATSATLTLDSNYTMIKDESTGLYDGIAIDKDITIDGNGYTIDANNLGRIFQIASTVTFTLANVTLANGNTTLNKVSAGAIYNEGKLVLKNVTFVNNSAKPYGGAIYNDGNLNMVDCNFVNNSAFTSPENGYGGAIYNMDNAGLTVSGCSFVNNSAEYGGGAIYNKGTAVTVDGCSFVNNSAPIDFGIGGAIFNNGANFNVSGCSFVNNSATYKAGAISNYATGLTVSGCSFVSNSATGDKGVGDAISSSDSCTATATDNWWGTNTPDFSKLLSGNVTHNNDAVLNLTATNNKVTVNFYRNGTNTVLPISRDVTLAITDQETVTGKTDKGTYTYDYTAPAGDYNITVSVDNEKLTLKMTNTAPKTFTDLNNLIKGAASGATLTLNSNYTMDDSEKDTFAEGITISKTITINGNGYTIDANNLGRIFKVSGSGVTFTLANVNLINGNIASYGGAIYNSWSNAKLVLKNVTFVNNSASSGGGAIYNYGANCIVSNNTFINNTVTESKARYGGGAIFNGGKNCTVSNNIFTNNMEKSERGGAIFMIDCVNCTVSNNNFTNNVANAVGGAICLYSGVDYCTVSNNTFTNNTANNGGAFSNSGANCIVSNNTFINNTASNSYGAFSNSGANCTVSNNTFTNNTATSEGGAIYNGGANFVVSDNTFTNNTATSEGGAIYLYKAVNCIVSNNNFTDNTASSGGVIYMTSSSTYCIVSNNNFTANTASSSGGVIYNDGADYCTVSNNTFINNTANNGGAIYMPSDVDYCTVSNNTFINNTANNGGAIYNLGKNCIVSNNNFTNNKANQGMVLYNGILRNVKGTVNLTNNKYSEITNGKTHIYNKGTIISSVTVTVLGNQTIPLSYAQKITLYANVTTADGASVTEGTLKFTINGNNYAATSQANGNYTYSYTTDFAGSKIVSATYANANNVAVKTAILDVILTDVYVDPEKGDDSNYGVSWNKAVKTISKAIELVSANGKIHLADGTHKAEGNIDVGKSVAIIGNGTKTVITSTVYVTAKNVAIYNCSFVNNSADWGAAIYNNGGSNLTVNGCSFVNTTAQHGGGAIYNYGGSDLTVSGCSFVNTTSANGNGNAIGSSVSCTATDNWWGTNNPDFKKLLTDNVVHNNDAVLTLTATNNNVAINFYKNGTTEVLPISRSLTLTIGDKTEDKEIVNGTFTTDYEAPAGNYAITASVDNEKLSADFVNYVYVDYNKGNDLNTGASWNTAVKTISHAMELVPENGKIYLADGTHSVATQVTIDKTIAIVGNGSKTVIYNGGNDRIFNITKNNVAIYNSTFEGDEDITFAGNGSAIYSTGANITVNGCTFSDNQASNEGTIYNKGANFTIENSIFTGNNAGMHGGVISNSGDNFTLRNSTFTGNWASNYGGVIRNYGANFIIENSNFAYNGAVQGGVIANSGDNFTIWNSTFTGNDAKYGGVILNSESANFTIWNSTFTNNKLKVDANHTTEHQGGVIYNYHGANFVVGNSTFTGNGIEYGQYDNVRFEGGVIYNSGTNLTVINSNFTDTMTYVCDGGVIYNNAVNFTLKDSTFSNNVAEQGGAIYIYDEADSVIVISNSTFNDNSATSTQGGAIWIYADIEEVFNNFTLENSTFSNNEASYGGAIYNMAAYLAVINSNFTYNSAYDGVAGAIYSRGGSLIVSESNFINNSALDNAGAIYSEDSSFSISNSDFANNTANGEAGAIYSGNGEFTVSTSVFNNNSAGYAGAIEFNGGNYKINNSKFNNNSAYGSVYGGVIFLNSGSLEIIGSEFNNNSAANAGGVIYNNAGAILINKSAFYNSSADNIGGVIYNSALADNLEIIDSTFDSSSSKFYDGGAIWNGANTLLVNGSTFTNNVANYAGAAIYNYNCGDAKIDNSTFTNNLVNYAGAAVYNYNANLTVLKSSFSDNAASKGVDIYNAKGAYLNLSDNTYSGIVSAKTDIYNEGIIVSPVTATVLDNMTFYTTPDQKFVLFANINTADGASVAGGLFNFTINPNNYSASSNDDGSYNYEYTLSDHGRYLVNASYGGAANMTVNTGVLVSQYVPDISAKADDIVYGETAKIVITLPEDAKGNVTASIDGKFYTGQVSDGKATIEVSGLNPDNYEVNLTYTGDEKYISKNLSTIFHVSKSSNYNLTIPKDVKVGETATITFNIPDGATGEVIISIDGVNKTATVDGGKASVEFTNLTAGTHNVVANYSGDDKYAAGIVPGVIIINKLDTPIDVKLPAGLKYGDRAVINITLNSDANGGVIVTVGNKDYDAVVKKGSASITTDPLAVGDYSVSLNYTGDNKYNAKLVESAGSFKVDRANAVLNVVINNVDYGNAFIIDAALSGVNNEALSGVVTVNVNGKNYEVKVENGRGNLTGDKLAADNYDFSATWAGNDNYTSASASGSFKVSRVTPSISVDVNNTIFGEKVNITVKLNSDASGNVMIYINDTDYGDFNVINGVANASLDNTLVAGTYTVKAEYTGDENYTDRIAVGTFVVSRANSNMNVTADDIVFGKDLVVETDLPSDATGKMTITVDGVVKAESEVTGGKITNSITDLAAGNHTVVVKYSGNDKYGSVEVTKTVKVAKANATLDVAIKDVDYNDIFTIEATLNDGTIKLSGNVIVNVNGKNYVVNITDGEGTLAGDKLAAGNYNFTASWAGNDNYNGSKDSGSFIVNQIIPNMDIDAKDIHVGEDAVITVKLNSDATGYVNVTIDGKNYTGELENGVATITVSNLANKTYDFVVNYYGDNNYSSNQKDGTIKVFKVSEYEVDVFIPDAVAGKNTTITVDVPEDATGNITIGVDGKNYTGKVENGTAYITIPPLDAGDYNLTVNYTGDDKYAGGVINATITVDKISDYDMNITVPEGVKVDENAVIKVNVPSDATGNVIINIDGISYNTTISEGVASITLNNLTAGPHNIVANYTGDGNHISKITNDTITIDKVSDYEINVQSPSGVKSGDVAIINVTLPGDASGTVAVKVGNTVYDAVVKNGKASITTDKLLGGNYTVDVTYNGDGKYVNKTVSAHNITVSNIVPDMILIVNNIVFGDDEIAYIDLGGDVVNNNITMYVDGVSKQLTLVEGKTIEIIGNLSAGTHNITVKYDGGGEYLPIEVTKFVNVTKANPILNVIINNVDYGEISFITATLNGVKGSALSDRISVKIGNNTYYVDIVNGTGISNELKLPAGNYTFKANWAGNQNYSDANYTGTFNVAKITPTMDISVSDIKVGQNEVIEVKLNDDVSGNVTITVDGEEYNATIEDGVATAVVSGLGNGTYVVDVVYPGDGNYTSNKANASFVVSKVSGYEVDVFIPDAVAGKNTTITVDVPEDATGNVTITVDGQNYTGKVENGTAYITIPPLDAGDYNLTVNYTGDDKYIGGVIDATITVDKISGYDMNIAAPEGVKVGDTAIIKVNVPDGATGIITISIEGKLYEAPIENGVAEFNVSGLSAGPHTILANYGGDTNYDKNTANAVIVIDKVSDYEFNVDVDPIESGDRAVINITLPGDANGTVAVKVGNKTYDGVVKNGSASVTTDELTTGEYPVNVTYSGNDKYTDGSKDAKVIVSPVSDYNMNITVPDDAKVGDNVTIAVNVPKDATGNVTITVDGEEFNATIKDGVATAVVYGLGNGTYVVDAVYPGDGNYTSNKANASFVVSKVSGYEVDVFIPDAVANKNTTITVDVPEDATGNVTITVDGQNYTGKVENGTAYITIPPLDAGDYNITVNYTGDGKYIGGVIEDTLTVDKISGYDMNITSPEGVKVGDNAIIKVNVPDGATGIITISIEDRLFEASIKDGVAEFNVSGLTAGPHTILANYGGDTNYDKNAANAVIVIDKVSDYEFNVDVDPIESGDKAVINITLPSDANGTIAVKVGNKTYDAVVKNGSASVTTDELTTGEYPVNVTYSGNDKYTDGSKDAKVIVSKISKYDMNITVPENVKVGDNAIIKVNVPSDATGNITISIEGKLYEAPIKNGVAEFNVSGLTAGPHTILANYDGDNNYDKNTANAIIVINKVSDYIFDVEVPSDIKAGDKAVINITLPDDANGTVAVKVGNKTYDAVVKNGSASVTIDELTPGDYPVNVTYSGNGKYDSGAKDTSITVVPGDDILYVDNVVMTYNDGSRLVANLTDYLGNPIANATLEFTINGVTYDRVTNVDGSASIAINLESGTYAANVTYGNLSKNVTVTVLPSIVGNDLVKMWMNDTQFYATFLDKYGKVLANTNVTFNIHGVFYNRTTNASGVAKLNINLDPGHYILTAYNPVSGEQKGFNITVKSLIETQDLTKYYNNASKFEVKVWNKNGTLGVNRTVTFNIHGVFYNRTADENGTVKLAITLRPGDYIITSMYEGLSIGNKVKVLPTLETSDISMKYGDGTKFTARTLDGQGNPLANQNLTFNIHGVFYNKTTGDDGIAELNINLNKGEYIITSYWEDYQIGNTIKVK